MVLVPEPTVLGRLSILAVVGLAYVCFSSVYYFVLVAAFAFAVASDYVFVALLWHVNTALVKAVNAAREFLATSTSAPGRSTC